MADIFLSYSRKDRDRIETLIDALGEEGFSVWWDKQLEGGARFSKETEANLKDAKAVVVAWSETSIDSMWVADEATIGRDQGTLVPICIDAVEPPIGFRQIQIIDFDQWRGDKQCGAFRRLETALKGRLNNNDNAQQHTELKPVETREGVSLIVLPLQTISTDPADEVLSLALYEDLTTQLARVKNYFVISRNTAAVFKGRTISSATLKKELGVTYAVEGSLRRAGDNIRISAQLIDTATGECLAAMNFDRSAADLMDLQNDLITEIVNHLGSELNLAEVRRFEARSETNPTALHYYNMANLAFSKNGFNSKAIDEAAACMTKALEIDPNFAPAMSQLALQKAVAATFGFCDSFEKEKEEVVALAERAINLDPHSSDVLGWAGCALCDVHEVERGFPHLERAIQLDPSNAQAHAAYGWACSLMGRPEQGLEMSEAAIRISPKQPGLAFWYYGLAMAYDHLREPEKARELLKRSIQFDPKFLTSYAYLAALCLENNDAGHAKKLIGAARKIDPEFSIAHFEKVVPKRIPRTIKKAGLMPDGATKQ